MAVDWDAVSVRILWGERVRCEWFWRLGRRDPVNESVMNKFSIWYVWAGRGTLQLHERRYNLRPGICLWMRPGGHYIVEQDLEDRLGVSAAHFDLLTADGRQLVPDERFPPEVHDLPDMLFVDAVLRRVVELMGNIEDQQRGDRRHERATAKLLLTGLLREIDAHADQVKALDEDGALRRRRREMLRIAALIRENPGSAPTVKELADEAGYTADHFGRVFEGVIGQSPQAYMVQVRLDRARQLLLSTDLSIHEIAGALGYQDVFFFSRQFKQKVGVPPSHYRRHASDLSVRTPAPAGRR